LLDRIAPLFDLRSQELRQFFVVQLAAFSIRRLTIAAFNILRVDVRALSFAFIAAVMSTMI